MIQSPWRYFLSRQSPGARLCRSRHDGWGLPRLLAALFAFSAICMCVPGQSAPPSANAAPVKPIVIDLQDALRRARAYSQQFQTAATNAAVARENRVQARAAELPTVNALNQFVYTEGNGTPSGVFIANDGVHVYNEQAVVNENLFSLFRHGQYRRTQAVEAAAIAQKEIAARGLVFTVTQDYYSLVDAQRKITNAVQALTEAQNFMDVTEKQEQAGDVSHVNVVKAQLQFEQRSRDLQNAKLATEQAQLTLGVLLFPEFDQNFTVVDDLSTVQPLASWPEVRALALERNPELRSAQASVREARFATTVARYGYLPALGLTFYYGIDANQFAAQASNVSGVNRSTLPNSVIAQRQNLGYAGQITLDIPVWNWGATRSRVRQSELQAKQAQFNLTAAQRRLYANLHSLYDQASIAEEQLSSLQRSRDLAAENLHLTLLRYSAGDATALEVVTAADSAALARNAYDDGLTHYHVALANLQTLTGSL